MLKFMMIILSAFGCGAHGDIINFVQDYFNIGFREALEKINIDFNLGIENSFKIDSRKLERIKQEQEYKKRQKELFEKEKTQKLINLCNYSIQLDKDIAELKKKIKLYDWEQYVETISLLEMEKENLDLEFNELVSKKAGE